MEFFPPTIPQPMWEQRGQIGFWTSIYSTIKGTLFSPSKAFTQFRWEGGLKNPILFFITLSLLGTLLAMPVIWHNLSLVNQGINWTLAWAIAGIPADIICSISLLFVFCGLLHLLLKSVGGLTTTFQTTFRVVCYVKVGVDFLYNPIAQLLVSLLSKIGISGLSIPFYLIFTLWSAYAMIVGLTKANQRGFLRCTIAVLGMQTLSSTTDYYLVPLLVQNSTKITRFFL